MASITGATCRAARGLLDWTQGDLASKASVAVSTIREFERDRVTPTRATRQVLQQAFERAGVEFTSNNGQASGVRLAPRSTAKDQA